MSAVQAKPPTKRFEARREAIIAAAAELINLKGVRGMTLADVAAKLDLVPTAVIYYFRNKEELAAACFRKAIERYDGVVQAAEAGKDRAQRLDLFLAAWFEDRRLAAVGERERLVMFNDLRGLHCDELDRDFMALFRRMRALLRPEVSDRDERQSNNAITHLVMSEVFWAVAWLGGHDVEDYDRVRRRMSDILCHGLAAPGADWTPLDLMETRVIEAGGGEISRETFLRAATALINEEGYLGASVEKISARLKVTKGAFYHHNEDKDDLVAACFDRTFQVVRRTVRAAEAKSANALQALTTTAVALARRQLSGDAPLLRNSALTSAPEALQPDLMRGFDRIAGRFAGLVSDGIADGSIRPVDVNIAAHMLNAAINASAELNPWVPGLTPDSVGEVFLRPLFVGVTPRV